MFLLLKCIYSYRRTRRKRKTRPANNIWTILGCPKAGKSDPKIAKIGDFSENVKINYLLPKNGWRFGTYYLCNIKSIKYWAFRAGLQIFRQKLTIFRVFWKMELLFSLCPWYATGKQKINYGRKSPKTRGFGALLKYE